MNKLDKKLYEILVNDEFINYILEPNQFLTEKWNSYFESHPDEKPLLEIARDILCTSEPEFKMNPFEMKELENEIMGKCAIPTYN